jgi:hypothetical protein
MKNICRDYMNKNCIRNNCKFIHDSELCVDFYKTGKCNNKDICTHTHKINNELLQNFLNNNRENKNNNNNNNKNNKNNKKPIKNTESFEADYTPPDMRIQYEYGKNRCELQIQSNDVIIVPDLFRDDKNIYEKILDEVFSTEYDKNILIKPWHEGCHLIVDDQNEWKKDCPTFNYVINKISDYFNMDIKATRLNWMQKLTDFKFQHHDAAALKPEKAKVQNFTVGVSFGYTRDIAFQVANHDNCRNVVSFPLPNGTTYCFSKDININWRHGVSAIKTDSSYIHKPSDGRISIIAWGYTKQVDVN